MKGNSMLDALRLVTRFDVEVSSANNALSKLQRYVRLLPLQTVTVQMRATLLVTPADAPAHERMKELAAEVGEADPLEAWKQALSQLSLVPVLTTRTDDPTFCGSSRDEGASDTTGSARIGTSAASLAAFAQCEVDYPIATQCAQSATPYGYISLVNPSFVTTTVSRDGAAVSNASFSPSGQQIARAPGTKHTQTLAVKMVDGAFSASLSQLLYTYTFSLTVPNIANGAGCIALRLGIGRDPRYAAGTVLGELHIATFVLRVLVASVMALDCSSKCVAHNRTHIQVMVTNLSSKNLQVHDVDLDLHSTRLGKYKDSLDAAGDLIPEYRLAPKAIHDSAIALLSSALVLIPLAVDEPRPFLRPLETFCFQFVVQLKPHLSYILLSHSSAVPPRTTPGLFKSGGAGVDYEGLVGGGSGGGGDNNNNEDKERAALEALLKNVFITAVHVHYQSDAVQDDNTVFRASRSVKWNLS